MLDTAIARPIPTARYVHAGLGRPQSRGGANGRHQGKGLGGRGSAINLPLGGDIRGERPLPSALCPPAPRVRRRSVARLSEHTGGLVAPQAVGLEAPLRVVIHSGGAFASQVRTKVSTFNLYALMPFIITRVMTGMIRKRTVVSGKGTV